MKKKINVKKLFSSNRFFYVVCVFFLLSFFIFGFSKIGDRVFINFNIFKLSAREEVKHDGCLDYIINTSESDKNIVKKVFATGMNLDSFKAACNYVNEIVYKNGDYKHISYNFDRKLHYYDIEKILYNANNSDIVKLEIIGQSVDNRNIYGLEIGYGDRVIYLDASMHAAEVASTVFLTKFINDLVYKYESGDKDIINALNNVKMVFIPSLNPDGYEVYNFGIESIRNKDLWIYQNKDRVNFRTFKYNANGVDLNRNFPSQNSGLYYNGKKLKSSVSLNKTVKNGRYFGNLDMGSEPETQAAIYYILKHQKNTVVYINMHSQGRVIYAGKPNLSSKFNNNTVKFANWVSKYTGYKVHGLSSEEVGEGNDGTITDFFSEMAHGFKFSTETLKLSADKYKGNFDSKYNTAVITLETLNDYTSDVSVFKREYYNYGIEDLLYGLLDY